MAEKVIVQLHALSLSKKCSNLRSSKIRMSSQLVFLNMNRYKEMWRKTPDILNPRFNTHLATGLVAIGFTGIVLGELPPFQSND